MFVFNDKVGKFIFTVELDSSASFNTPKIRLIEPVLKRCNVTSK